MSEQKDVSQIIDWKPTIARRGREVALIFDTLEEAFKAFELLANYDPNKDKRDDAGVLS